MANDWQMPRRNDACARCEKPFEIEAALRAFLFETPQGYVRSDYCESCEAPTDPAPVGSWRTVRRAPATKKAVFDADAIFTLFEQLEGTAVASQQQLRFCIALLLWRKKVLRLEGSQADGGVESWRYSSARGSASYEVVRPELDDAEVERLSVQLEALMSGEASPELVEQLAVPTGAVADADPVSEDANG